MAGFLEELRQRYGLDEDDSSKDEEILELSPFQRVRMICGWYLGYPSWADNFRDFCRSQGIYLTTKKEHEMED